MLTAMALVDQHENVRGFVHDATLVQPGAEFMDQGRDDRRLVLDQREQILARRRPFRLLADSAEGIRNLLVEVGTVGDDHDARGRVAHRDRLGQHHHG